VTHTIKKDIILSKQKHYSVCVCVCVFVA